jgi:KaiC/GvpD/RAD55 family RecA-like ATPase
MSDNNTGEILGFDKDVQKAVVGWMLADTTFFLKCYANLKYNYFQDPVLADIVKIMFEMYEQNTQHPKIIDLKSYINAVRYDRKECNERFYLIDECLRFKETSTKEVLAEQLHGWKAYVTTQNNLRHIALIWNKKDYVTSGKLLLKAAEDIRNSTFDSGDLVQLGNGLDHFKNREVTRQFACTMGHEEFDELLMEGSKIPPSEWGSPSVDSKGNLGHYDISKRTRGCLLPGDTTVLLGPSNSGKTSAVISIVKANLEMHKKVLLITLEMTEDVILDKLYSNITGKTIRELSSVSQPGPALEEVKKAIKAADAMMLKNLSYIHHVKSGEMYVEDVLAKLKMAQEQMKTRRAEERQAFREALRKTNQLTDEIAQKLLDLDEKRRGYDLVVVDYPSKLKSRALGNKRIGSYEEHTYVYDQFIIAAQQEKFHAILPVQSNRDGLKITKADKDTRMLGQEDVANAFGISQVAGYFITINRSPEDKAKNIIKFYIDKSRQGATGTTFISRTDFSCSRTHDVRLPGVAFGPGYKFSNEEVDKVLGNYRKPQPVLQMPEAKSPVSANDFNDGQDVG